MLTNLTEKHIYEISEVFHIVLMFCRDMKIKPTEGFSYSTFRLSKRFCQKAISFYTQKIEGRTSYGLTKWLRGPHLARGQSFGDPCSKSNSIRFSAECSPFHSSCETSLGPCKTAKREGRRPLKTLSSVLTLDSNKK